MNATTPAATHHSYRLLTGKTAFTTGDAKIVGVEIPAAGRANKMAGMRERGIDARGITANIADLALT